MPMDTKMATGKNIRLPFLEPANIPGFRDLILVIHVLFQFSGIIYKIINYIIKQGGTVVKPFEYQFPS